MSSYSPRSTTPPGSWRRGGTTTTTSDRTARSGTRHRLGMPTGCTPALRSPRPPRRAKGHARRPRKVSMYTSFVESVRKPLGAAPGDLGRPEFLPSRGPVFRGGSVGQRTNITGGTTNGGRSSEIVGRSAALGRAPRSDDADALWCVAIVKCSGGTAAAPLPQSQQRPRFRISTHGIGQKRLGSGRGGLKEGHGTCTNQERDCVSVLAPEARRGGSVAFSSRKGGTPPSAPML
jgi:hypothetical protein